MNERLQAMVEGRVERPLRSSVDAEVRHLIEGMLADDWAHGLACQRLLLEDYLPWLERRSVRRARRAGRSWASIARVMGRARQTVHERFADLERDPHVGMMLPPPLPVDPVRVADVATADLLRDLARRREADDAAATGSLVPW